MRPRSPTRTQGWTPLHIAAREGRLEVARLLLEGGADIKAKNDVRALAFASLRTRCCARLRARGALPLRCALLHARSAA
jgi:ankyrin repeat protein